MICELVRSFLMKNKKDGRTAGSQQRGVILPDLPEPFQYNVTSASPRGQSAPRFNQRKLDQSVVLKLESGRASEPSSTGWL